MTWEQCYTLYRIEPVEERLGALLTYTDKLIAQATPSTVAWLTAALDPLIPYLPEGPPYHSEKRFAVWVLRRSLLIPEALIAPLIRAAVYEPSPSDNRVFVDLALKGVGYRVVNEQLLDYVEQGTLPEKQGALRALYWAQMPVAYVGGLAPEHLDPTTYAAYQELRDVWLRKRCVFLQAFLNNEDLLIRQVCLAGIEPLDPADYPVALQPLIPIARELARAHPDARIRELGATAQRNAGPNIQSTLIELRRDAGGSRRGIRELLQQIRQGTPEHALAALAEVKRADLFFYIMHLLGVEAETLARQQATKIAAEFGGALPKTFLVGLVRRLQAVEGTPEDRRVWRCLLQEQLPHPLVAGLIYWPHLYGLPENSSAQEIVEHALAYQVALAP